MCVYSGGTPGKEAGSLPPATIQSSFPPVIVIVISLGGCPVVGGCKNEAGICGVPPADMHGNRMFDRPGGSGKRGRSVGGGGVCGITQDEFMNGMVGCTCTCAGWRTEQYTVGWLRPALHWLAVCRNGVDDDLGVCCRCMGWEEDGGGLRISNVEVTT